MGVPRLKGLGPIFLIGKDEKIQKCDQKKWNTGGKDHVFYKFSRFFVHVGPPILRFFPVRRDGHKIRLDPQSRQKQTEKVVPLQNHRCGLLRGVKADPLRLQKVPIHGKGYDPIPIKDQLQRADRAGAGM